MGYVSAAKVLALTCPPTVVEGLVGGQGSCGENEVFGFRYADEAREALSSASSGNDPQPSFR